MLVRSCSAWRPPASPAATATRCAPTSRRCRARLDDIDKRRDVEYKEQVVRLRKCWIRATAADAATRPTRRQVAKTETDIERCRAHRRAVARRRAGRAARFARARTIFAQPDSRRESRMEQTADGRSSTSRPVVARRQGQLWGHGGRSGRGGQRDDGRRFLTGHSSRRSRPIRAARPAFSRRPSRSWPRTSTRTPPRSFRRCSTPNAPPRGSPEAIGALERDSSSSRSDPTLGRCSPTHEALPKVPRAADRQARDKQLAKMPRADARVSVWRPASRT